MSERKIAIIPARGGSKRIPRKNIREFLGTPIISYAINAAVQSGIFDEIMVSTDDEEIAGVAKGLGANIPFMRSAEKSNDFATTLDVIAEVIDCYKIRGQTFDFICCIYPTAALIQVRHLLEGLQELIRQKRDTVFPIVPFGYPVWRGLQIGIDGKTRMVWPENMKSRSQDLAMVYHDAGQWYWIDNRKPLESIFTENTGSIVLDESEVQDIDNSSDWLLAELKYKILNGV